MGGLRHHGAVIACSRGTSCLHFSLLAGQRDVTKADLPTTSLPTPHFFEHKLYDGLKPTNVSFQCLGTKPRHEWELLWRSVIHELDGEASSPRDRGSHGMITKRWPSFHSPRSKRHQMDSFSHINHPAGGVERRLPEPGWTAPAVRGSPVASCIRVFRLTANGTWKAVRVAGKTTTWASLRFPQREHSPHSHVDVCRVFPNPLRRLPQTDVLCFFPYPAKK